MPAIRLPLILPSVLSRCASRPRSRSSPRSVPDGDYLEGFFVDLGRPLDAMNSVF